MSLPVQANPQMMVTSRYKIPVSLRYRSSATAYMNRTPAVAGNQQKFTISLWFKRGALSTYSALFDAYSGAGANYGILQLQSDNTLVWFNQTASSITMYLNTSAVYRDPAAWYHVVAVYDSAQATAANRASLYVNGQQITAFGTATYPAQNAANTINSVAPHDIARYGGASNYFDGYLAEINFIDGQALNQFYFGAYDSNGIWQPLRYNNAYGTNGFYLPFSNVSLNTLLSNASNISAPFGGVATNALVADGVYCISNNSTGSSFVFLLNDFTGPTQETRFAITNLYFTGGSSTFLVQTSYDNVSWTTQATLSVTGSAQNFSGSLNTNVRYVRLYASAFGTNGQAYVDAFLIYQDGLGLDLSGNGNNWTPNNISLTAGSTYDSMTDSPTVSSATVANYATMNPLDTGSTMTLSEGNLKTTSTATSNTSRGTIGMTSGKWYWEVQVVSGGNYVVGIGTGTFSNSTSAFTAYAGGYGYVDNGNKQNNGTPVAYGGTMAAGDIIGVAFDATAGSLTFYKNNTSQGVAYTGLTNGPYFPAASCQSSVMVANFGQRPFTYTPPTGYSALNTYNLPTPTIANGAQYMAATTYTGTGAALTVNNGINTTIGTTFQPDFLWLKNRSLGTGGNHVVFDVVRGGPSNELYPNLTNTEAATTGALASLNSNGFTLSNGGDLVRYNSNTNAYVAWQWKAGGTGITNTNGSITSTVSANQTAGFSVVTYTGTGANATVGHGLGVAPYMIIAKNRTNANNWAVYHSSLTSAAYYLSLNQTIAQTNNATLWNSTAPTSSIFNIGTAGDTNGGGTNLVAYCWAAVPGYSAFGSYTGNGSTDGPFIYLGFRPRWWLVKRTDTVESWNILDSSRDPYNQAGINLYPNLTNAESSNDLADLVSNGVKLRNTWTGANTNGGTYIYAAFAENPFALARAR